MDGTVAYALANKKIKELSGPEINKAVSAYLETHPTALQESLGLKVENGQLCVVEDN